MMGRIDMILSGGDCDVGLESTVISLKGNSIHLLRPGYVTVQDLSEVCDDIVVSSAVLSALGEGDRPESPGMKYRHYAPDASVTMVKGEENKILPFFKQKLADGYAVLCFDEDLDFLENHPNAIRFGSRNDLFSQASGLFDALRKLDDLQVNGIYARFTVREGLGLAISNRLLRACAFQELEI
jgi:L-threonylcarbamoyladenylate synthase